jgi:co-chaperonin GroES (HSP10)
MSAEDDLRNVICPIRDNIYIERSIEKQSAGGIIFPETFNYRFSARLKMNAIPDVFRAKVLAVGTDTRELRDGDGVAIAYGDEVYVYSYAEGDGSKLYTGESVGEKSRIFIKPKDIVFAVTR